MCLSCVFLARIVKKHLARCQLRSSKHCWQRCCIYFPCMHILSNPSFENQSPNLLFYSNSNITLSRNKPLTTVLKLSILSHVRMHCNIGFFKIQTSSSIQTPTSPYVEQIRLCFNSKTSTRCLRMRCNSQLSNSKPPRLFKLQHHPT